MAAIKKILTGMLIGLIKLYQVCISPVLGPRCRFYPTCSQYAIDAIRIQGLPKGLFLALKRLLRCHPGSKGGYEPVDKKG